MELICPFCGHDPYHYVDIGVGRQPVAVECCELGVAYFTGESETVEIDRSDFDEIAKRLRALPDSGEVEKLQAALQNAMGYLDTPVARRKLAIDPNSEWLLEARALAGTKP